MTCRARREPWPLGLLRLLGVAAALVAVGYGLYGVGWCLDWMSSTAWGANP